MIFHTAFVLAGLFGLIQLFRVKDVFAKLILAVLVTSIAMFYIAIGPARPVSFALFFFGCLLTIVYGLMKEGLTVKKRRIVLAIAIPVLIVYAFGLFDWPFVLMVKALLVIPLVAYIYILANHQKFKIEIGFLTILVADAFYRFSLIFLSGFS